MVFKIVPFRNEDMRRQDLVSPDDRLIVMNYQIGIDFLSDRFGGYLELWSSGDIVKTFYIAIREDKPSMYGKIYNYLNTTDDFA